MRAHRNIRIVIRHPGLVRAGSNLLVLGLFLAAFYAADPWNACWGLWPIAPLRYAPILAASASIPCLLLGLRGVPMGWPVLMLGAFAAACVSGGAYTLTTRNASLMESFTGRGLCAITVLPVYMVCLVPKERRHIAKQASRIVSTAALAMVPVLVAWRLGYRFADQAHLYHMSAIYFCSAAGFALADKRPVVRRAATALFGLANVLTVKLTGFGFAAILALLLWRVETFGHSRETGQRRMHRRVLITQIVISTAVAAGLLAAAMRAYLPTGSREVRLQTYAQRLDMFLDDPVFGTFFTGSPIMEVGLLIIPSHSDLLDLLAFGGVIGAALFYAPAMACVVHGVRSIRRFTSTGNGLGMFGLTTVVCFLWQSAANPVLGDPRFITLYWIALGTLLADRVTASHLPAPSGAGSPSPSPGSAPPRPAAQPHAFARQR